MPDPAVPEELPLRLLVVSDDLAYADLVRSWLAEQLPGAEVEQAADLAGGRLALAARPDVVLADLALPGLATLEVVGALRIACPETAVVVLCGVAGEDFALQAIAAGADDCLAKAATDAGVVGVAVRRAVERSRAETVRQRRERYATSLLEATGSSTCAVDEDGVVLSVNEPWRAHAVANNGDPAACGVGIDYLKACETATGDRSEGAGQVAAGLRAVLAGALPRFEHEYACHTPDDQHWYSVRITPQPDGGGAVITHVDVTGSRLAGRASERAALHNATTGLPNAILLADRLEQALAEGGRLGHLVAVALVDVDVVGGLAQLPRVTAAAVLEQVADRLTGCARDGDTVAQLPDGRFAVVWRNLASAAEVSTLHDRVSSAVSAPLTVLGQLFEPVVTLGVAADEWAQTGEELLAAAGDLMHLARADPAPLTATATPARSEAALREAMRRGELVVHYQPVVHLLHGVVTGVEALVRWQHPTDGLLGPDTFIPVAESGGLIVELGARVLEQACRQGAGWLAEGRRLDIAVNLSTRQVAHPDLLSTVVRVLHQTGLPAGSLVLEVTESAVMEDAEAAAAVLNALTDLGVHLAIDDFGTGYSSLLYLKRYPIQALKVDRSFVAGIGVNARDDAIVASVVGLARGVGGSCIAEGVETREQYDALLDLGCESGQGWLFGRAVPASELVELIGGCEEKLAELHAAHLEPDQRDEAGRQRDEAAEDRDQAGDDRDSAGDERDDVADRRDAVAERRDQAGDRRDEAGDERDQVGELRDQAGRRRDADADRRDVAADRRDQAADRRDAAADERDAEAAREEGRLDVDDTGALLQLSALARREAASDRERASQDRQDGALERDQAVDDRGTALLDRDAGADERTQAELDRNVALADRRAGRGERGQADTDRHTALADRDAGAGERTRADHDRHTASADRGASARERSIASLDGPTGAYLQGPGGLELQREVARARRTGQALAVALLAVDGRPDDATGGTDDRLLAAVAAALRSALRSYDLVVRHGADAFLCALPGASLQEARTRLTLVDATLAISAPTAALSVGLAELGPGDAAADLVARAESELGRNRRQ